MNIEFRKKLGDGHKVLYDIFYECSKLSKVFVETGCNDGDGLVRASECEFTDLYSCDIFLDKVNKCLNILSKVKDKNIVIKNSSSTDFLKSILPSIDKSIFFWLDAHGEGGGVPTFEELDIIKDYSKINSNIILIDDIPLYFNNDRDKQNLISKIKRINSNYNIEFLDVVNHKEYLLLAKIK